MMNFHTDEKYMYKYKLSELKVSFEFLIAGLSGLVLSSLNMVPL